MERSLFAMMAMIPVKNARTPDTIPASIVNARAGLAAISCMMELPDGVDAYNVFVNDVPMKNRIGMAMINPMDHFPSLASSLWKN